MAKKTSSPQSETSPEILMLGFLCIKGADSINEKVSILDRFGLADSDIAVVCNCAVQSVRNARQQNAKKPKD
jgi:hypothetical protein